MSNQDKAAQVIYDEVNQTWARGEILTAAGEAERLANALADAGLLTPDLPEPCIYPDTGEHEWHLDNGYVSVEDGIIHVIHDETDDDNEPDALMPDWAELRFSTTAKARENAYAILAACDLKDTQDE